MLVFTFSAWLQVSSITRSRIAFSVIATRRDLATFTSQLRPQSHSTQQPLSSSYNAPPSPRLTPEIGAIPSVILPRTSTLKSGVYIVLIQYCLEQSTTLLHVGRNNDGKQLRSRHTSDTTRLDVPLRRVICSVDGACDVAFSGCRNGMHPPSFSVAVAGVIPAQNLSVAIPTYLLDRLQSVMNAAARSIACLRCSDHITDTLASFHWLWVPEQITFKLAVIVYRAPYRHCLFSAVVWRLISSAAVFVDYIVVPAKWHSSLRTL